ncbi:porin [Janthinobacterium fluminis]|uniref:Porin n=1 Tax=Janthinobacterium fluminis TaxID=2987524 RepID=A0ABT5JYF6_9BURK|nr:porin [Janthinobacterium fluminis]MDC8757183.1 porin [Janthinobacterium fluminis]
MHKKTSILILLAALAGAVQAQSGVTIYGSIDGGLRNQTNVNAAGDSKLSIGSNGQYYPNRLGFIGSEDLGDGMKVHFKLESGFNTGTGALDNSGGRLFNRSSWVGVSGKWGQLNFGHQYTIAFFTANDYDPFNYKYAYIIPVSAATAGGRYDNNIQYTGTFGAYKVRAEYAPGEKAGNAGTNTAKAVGLSYADGPLNWGGAYSRRDVDGYSDTHYTVGGAYKTGGWRLAAGYMDDKLATATGSDSTTKNAWGGLSYDVSPQLIVTGAYYQTKVSVANIGGAKKLAMLGVVYYLSKRSNLYADIDHAKLSGRSRIGAQTSQTGISIGIDHLF